MSAEHGPHFRPWEIGLLTLAEITLLMEDGTPKPDTGKVMGGSGTTREQAIAYRNWILGMSPAERLAHARVGEL
jgi:hypothetical protein